MKISTSPLVLAAAAWSILLGFMPNSALAVPSYARQTGLACDACHTSYPGLTAFGREFKLSAYTLSAIKQVTTPPSPSAPGMAINQIPNLSVILQMQERHVKNDPSANNSWEAKFPSELGLYYAGRIAPHLGTFLQLTYAQGEGVSMDMSDIRYARTAKMGHGNLVWGVDANNGPTFEDVWNSTAGFGWPYVEGADRPMPFIASEAVMTNVIGTGGYVYWNGLIYGYLGVYQSATQGDNPAIHGAAPYYRLAITPTPNFEIGSFGFFAQRPCYTEVGGYAPDGSLASCAGHGRINDVGADMQYQWYPSENNLFSAHLRYTHEKQTGLQETYGQAGYTGPNSVTTNYALADIGWIYRHRHGLSFGVFTVWGSPSDYYSGVFPDDYSPGSGPDSTGEIIDYDFYPWENVRLSAQFTLFNKLHGTRTGASDHNALVLNALLGF